MAYMCWDGLQQTYMTALSHKAAEIMDGWMNVYRETFHCISMDNAWLCVLAPSHLFVSQQSPLPTASLHDITNAD